MELRGLSPQVQGERISIPGRLKIGRDKADLVLADDLVSFQHALIMEKDGKYYLADTHSLSGTYLNDQKIEANKRVELKPRDRITIGNHIFEFIGRDTKTDDHPKLSKRILDSIESKVEVAGVMAALNPPPLPIWREPVGAVRRVGAGLFDTIVFAWTSYLVGQSFGARVVAFFALWTIVRSFFHVALGQSPGEILFRVEIRDKNKESYASVNGAILNNVLSVIFNSLGLISFWSSFLQERSLAERMSGVALVPKAELLKSATFYRIMLVVILAAGPMMAAYRSFFQDPRVSMVPETFESAGTGWGKAGYAFFDLEMPWRLSSDLLTKLEYRKGPPERFWHEVSFLLSPQSTASEPIQITIFGRRALPVRNPQEIFRAEGLASSLFLSAQVDQIRNLMQKRAELTRDDGTIEKVIMGKNNAGLDLLFKQWALSGNRTLSEIMFFQGDRQITVAIRGSREQSGEIQNIAMDIAAKAKWRPVNEQINFVNAQLAGFKASPQANSNAEGQTLLVSKFSVDPKDIHAYYTLASLQAQMISEVKNQPMKFSVIVNNLSAIYRTMLDVDPTSSETRAIERLVAQVN